MPYRRKRPTRRTRRYTRRKKLPAVRERRTAFTEILKLTPAGTTTVSTTADVPSPQSDDDLVSIVGMNGMFQLGIFHGAADQDCEVMLCLATPLADADSGLSDAVVKAFDPFQESNWQQPAVIRGFNVVKLHRLANAHPAGAPNTLYTFNRRLTRRFKRVVNPNRQIMLAMYARGNANVKAVADGALKWVIR